MTTVSYVVKEIRGQLALHAIDLSEAELIIAHCLRRDLSWVLSHPEAVIQPAEEKEIYSVAASRCAGFPLAVLKGQKEFYGLLFRVTEDTLVPRPESELLVEQALKILKAQRRARVLDIGTGSGNLIIAIAKHAPRSGKFSWYACDLSEKALRVARDNAKTHGVPVRFYHSNLFSHVPKKKYDLIVANLPYLSTEQLIEPTLRREPAGALWGGTSGTDIYKKFIGEMPRYLAAGGSLLIEIDPAQAKTLARELRAALPGCALAAHADLNGRLRVIEADRS